jgi:FAD binding domain
LETAWLIGCDGAHSTVRHTLGMSFLGDTLQSDWMLADIHMKGYPYPESEIATYWHQDGVLVVFPISPGRFRVIADAGLAAGVHPADPTLDQVQAVVDKRGPAGLVVSDPVWLSAFRINERKVANYRSGRVFLAGDAAHVHSPAGGQGMNTGMQDAFNLAWKLALVCRKACSDKLLDSYSVERSAVGEQVLKAAGRLTAVATMKNHTAQTLRNLIGRVVLGLAPFRNAMMDTMTEISIGYQKSPLNGPNVHGAVPAPGERVAPIVGQIPVGSGDAPRFVLFAQSSNATIALIEKFKGLLDPDIRPPLNSAGMWLVRPDGYASCLAMNEEVKVLGDYLHAIGPYSK